MAPIAAQLVSLTGLNRRLPFRSATLILQVPLYGVPGILLYSILVLVAPGWVTPLGASFLGLVRGAALGIGLAAAGSALGRGSLLLSSLLLKQRDRPADPLQELSTFADTGWLRGFSLAQRVWPRGGYGLAVLSIAGEELIHRGLSLPLFCGTLGPRLGLLLSVACFMWFQTIGMPLIMAQMPMAAALVMGGVMGYLALTQHEVFPLIVAHYFFFATLVYLAPKAAEAQGKGKRAGYAGY